MFRLGYFHVFYKDGTKESISILWGENVGPATEPHALKKLMSSTREPIFTCDFEDKGDQRYYRFVIPTHKEVERVETEVFEKFKDNLIVDSIRIQN